MTDRFPAEVRIAIACGALALGAVISLLASAASAENVKVAVEDADFAQVEQLLSQPSAHSLSAPCLWSSYLKTRWNARWEASPHYAV